MTSGPGKKWFSILLTGPSIFIWSRWIFFGGFAIRSSIRPSTFRLFKQSKLFSCKRYKRSVKLLQFLNINSSLIFFYFPLQFFSQSPFWSKTILIHLPHELVPSWIIKRVQSGWVRWPVIVVRKRREVLKAPLLAFLMRVGFCPVLLKHPVVSEIFVSKS